MGRKLDIYPSLFNHLWGSNNPKIQAPIPKFAEIVNNPDVLRKLIMLSVEVGEEDEGMAVRIAQQEIIGRVRKNSGGKRQAHYQPQVGTGTRV